MQQRMQRLVRHLEALVAVDTTNPPRKIDAQSPIFGYLLAQLPGFQHELVDHGDGCVSLLAWRGRPTVLMNAHLDTVPAAGQWSADPFTLRVTDERAIGLGACDIKGGAAAMLSAVADVDGDAALLFTTDEEYGESVCVHRFLASGHPVLTDTRLVVVSEPSGGQAIVAHRGFVRGEATFRTEPGHSADPRGLRDNANHQLEGF